MKNLSTLVFIVAISFGVCAQKNTSPVQYANSITKQDLMDYLNVLASDSLEGRETGERGQKMAAAYISNHYKALGLEAPVSVGNQMSFYQDVPLRKQYVSMASISTEKQSYDNFNKIIFVGGGYATGEFSTKLIFVGDGSDKSYEGLDVSGKVVLVFTENNGAKMADASNKAKSKGAKAVLVIRTATDDAMDINFKDYQSHASEAKMSIDQGLENMPFYGMFHVAPSILPELIGRSHKSLTSSILSFSEGDKSALKKVKARNVQITVERTEAEVSTENVMGYLEGADLKNELLVITSHYDHNGIRGDEIYNGADDDGSGTAAVMDIAQAFAMAKAEGNGPRRSILFLSFTGEEKGLLGSEYYASDPVFPLESTITNLNIDMIGRNEQLNFEGEDYVYLIGSNRLSTELHDISENANSTYINLRLDYLFNDESHPDRFYYRSDHWNFAKNGVPIIFYFAGTHVDYHKPTDTVEKIEQDVYQKRARLAFYTAWELANRNKRPALDVLETN